MGVWTLPRRKFGSAPVHRVFPGTIRAVTTSKDLHNRDNLNEHAGLRARTMATTIAPAPTRLTYQYDECLREDTTVVKAIHAFSALPPEEQALFKDGNEQTQVVELEETIFYVQGGGQPCDTGSIVDGEVGDEQNFTVHAVRYGAEGRVLHFGNCTTGGPFQTQQLVTMRIDDARRVLNSRIHTAGHIVSLAVRSLAAKTPELDVTELKAQHYPSASFVDFKGLIDGSYKDAIQKQASDFVSSNLAITIAFYAPEELSTSGVITPEGMPVVSSKENGKVRVVDIVGAGPGGSSGAYPCGGTHVEHSGKVGRVVVRNIKRSKGNTKISYEVADD